MKREMAVKQNKAELYHAIGQFLKFNVVGVFNTIVDFVVYSIMCIFGLHYMLAQVIGYAFGVGNSYLMNSLWTFSRERKHTADEFGRFLLVNLASLGVSLLALWAGHNLMGIESDLWCKLIATPAALIVNFAGNKLFVFKGGSPAQGEAKLKAEAKAASSREEKTPDTQE